MSAVEFGIGSMQFAVEVEKEEEKLIGTPYRWALMLLGGKGPLSTEDRLIKSGTERTEREAWDAADAWITVGLADMLERAAARSAAKLGGDDAALIQAHREQKILKPKTSLVTEIAATSMPLTIE